MFEVLTAVAMKIAVCWFNSVQSGRCAYMHITLHGFTFQKTFTTSENAINRKRLRTKNWYALTTDILTDLSQ